MKPQKDLHRISMSERYQHILSVYGKVRKKKGFEFALVILWMFIFLFLYSQGRSQISLPEFKIGEVVPDVSMAGIRHDSAFTSKLSDYKGKLVILDFWATWCQPCIRMKPEIDSLQKQFAGTVQFLSVTSQPSFIVLPFLKRLNKQHPVNLVEVMNDTALTAMFKPTSLPQFVWIDPDGKLLGFSDESQINSSTIQSVLNGGGLHSSENVVNIIDYDIQEKPLFEDTNCSKDNGVVYHSVLTDYKEGLPCISYDSGMPVQGKTRRITMVNQTVAQLYQMAFRGNHRPFGWERTILAVNDTTFLNTDLGGSPFSAWLKNNRGYCYELVVPVNVASSALDLMQHDLRVLFPQYVATVEKRMRPCLALVVTKDSVTAFTKGEKPSADFDFTQAVLRNCSLDVLVRRIAFYLQLYKVPVVNKTGYLPFVDLDIHADLSNIDSVNKSLANYNLSFKKQDLETEVLVIKDKPDY